MQNRKHREREQKKKIEIEKRNNLFISLSSTWIIARAHIHLCLVSSFLVFTELKRKKWNCFGGGRQTNKFRSNSSRPTHKGIMNGRYSKRWRAGVRIVFGIGSWSRGRALCGYCSVFAIYLSSIHLFILYIPNTFIRFILYPFMWRCKPVEVAVYSINVKRVRRWRFDIGMKSQQHCRHQSKAYASFL